MPRPLRFVVIGNPENRRVHLFRMAVSSLARAAADGADAYQPECHVLAYEGLLTGRQCLGQLLAPGTILRIDSPGENFAVERLLVARGADAAGTAGCHWISSKDALQLDSDRGRIYFPRQWYFGFRSLMQEVAADVAACGGVLCMSDPHDIVTMFDKAVCRERLGGCQVPIAEALPEAKDFQQLRQAMRDAEMPRVFVKLANGSSASGVVALQIGRQRMSATTSVELVSQAGEPRLYNSLRLRSYHREAEIAAILNWLCRESVVVERWLPKAAADGKSFDLRLLAFPSGIRHVVVRQSQGPITNLHLGNTRGNWDAIRNRMRDGLLLLEATCQKISASFARTQCIAVDALILPNFRDHRVLELNAFGDLLPGVLHDGHDTYQAGIAQMIASTSADCS